MPGVQLDVFSLGAITYRIFAGDAPATTPEELVSAVRDGGLNLAAVADGIPTSLATMVYDATHGDPSQRLPSVAAFRAGLEAVWDELTAPEPEPVVNPLEAHKGDVLDGGYTVVRRLGTGATATALLVTPPAADPAADGGGEPAGERAAGRRELVLKVARDEQYVDRLAAEARTLRAMRPHWQVAALVDGPVTIGGRTALVLESAGTRTLAEALAGWRWTCWSGTAGTCWTSSRSWRVRGSGTQAEPVLLTDAAPLARYGNLRLLQELADPTRPRPAARLLLVPARRPEPAMLDQAQLPLTSPASQSVWLPDSWITPTAALRTSTGPS